MTGAPLRGLRVVGIGDELLPSLTKSFVDLGADVEVLRVAGSGDRGRPLRDLLEARGKRFTTPPRERAAARALVDDRLAAAGAAIVTPAAARACGYPGVDELAEAHPDLVVAVLTDFGLTGERAGWTGSEAVYKALGGTLSRSGQPGGTPLLQPGDLFTRSAAQEIAWAVLVAVHRSVRSPDRRGAVLDCSVFEAGAVCLDPAYGMAGSGTPETVDAYDRPDAADIYPIFHVTDGHVRMCALAKAQWLALLDWMGNPAELAGEALHTNPGRWAAADLIMPIVRAFVAPMTCAEMVRECRERRIPASRVLTVGEVLTEEHYRQSGVLDEVGRVDGTAVVSAEGTARIDGIRTVPRTATGPDPEWPPAATAATGPYPLSGLTVLDLGVIVAGAVVGELFAQQGARVIRVENTAFPDGMRRSFDAVTPSLARGHRGKESIGIDLRSAEGRAIFHELARQADIVTSNFKPGTVERLGISYADLAAINPRIVCVESSAFGDTGPWRTAMGYGPLVRAGTGQTWLWRADGDSEYFADGITIFPDHLVGRVCALAALACVLDRERTGRGAHVTVAQSDVGLVQLNELLAAESLAPGSAQPPGDVSTHLLREVVLPAAGEDQWCVVDPQTVEQRETLRDIVGAGADLDAAVAAYVRDRTADDVAHTLQAAGVPAGRMLRVIELPDDPGIRSRGLYEVTPVSGTADEVLVERFPVLSADLRGPQLFPMPMFGAHTRPVLAELGYPPERIEQLVADGVAQESRMVAAQGG